MFLFAWHILRKALYVLSDPSTATPATYKLNFETCMFQTADGLTLEGWYIPVKNAKAVIVIPHSYIYTKSTILTHAKYLHDGGYSTFFIDLRTDLSKGKHTFGTHEWKDVVAAYDYMRSLPENKKKKIGFYSGSMGGVSSIIAAGKTGKGDFLIVSVLYANFTSLFASGLKFKNLPLFLLPFIKLAALIELGPYYYKQTADRHIEKINKPIFFMSAKHDQTVNKYDTARLFNQANKPKDFWEANADHDIILDQPEQLKKRVLHFLDKFVA